MPNTQTMRRAISVARSMSLAAPLVFCCRNSSSAMRPPIRIATCASRYSFECVWRSPVGNCTVTPNARPRGMIVTLCKGSVFGNAHGDDRMPRLVVRARQPLRRRHHERTALDAHQHLVAGRLEVRRGEGRPPFTAGVQRRLVHHVGELGPREAGCPASHHRQVDVRRERQPPRVHGDDGLPPLHVREPDVHLPIEPTGPQERGVEHVGAVGRRHDDDVAVTLEAVHLDQSWLRVCSRSSCVVDWLPPVAVPTASSSSTNTMHGS